MREQPTASFYQIPRTFLTPAEIRRGICRVVAKAWRTLGQADVYCSLPEDVEILDDLLWTFNAGAFVPHGPDPAEPVFLTHQDERIREETPVLVLSGPGGIPPAANRCRRIVDFIPAREQERKDARERYRLLKQAGYIMQIYHLEA